MQGFVWKRDKSEMFGESACGVVLGIDKQADQAGLFGYQSGSAYGFGQQEFSKSFTLFLA